MTDWQVGDLAMCLNDTGWNSITTGVSRQGPRKGEVCKVRDLRARPQEIAEGPDVYLVFWDFADAAFPESSFRKIRPSAVSEIEKLRALCDVPSGVRA